ncbi:MAG: SH3 domain-containing protein [Chloroflexi bacterium]|nr:SH3 domain-containing protein [Chloroflexota bacterium]
MKSKLFILVLTLAAFVAVVIANPETYRIRVQYNTNLRASNSLDSALLASAPAGTTLQVVGQVENWLQINRAGALYWMAAWVNHSRVEDPVTAQPAGNVPSNIDNCCFVDRQCHSDQDWTNGYWAFQNGQCAAPAPAQPQSPAQPASNIPAGVDNCCQVDRQCHTAADWENGYYAFRDNQCAASAPAQPQAQSPAQPVSNAPAAVDNCCQVDRQCHTEADWTNGYYAYQNGQCDGSPQPQSPAQPAGGIPEGSDNCCRVNRECHSEADWVSGWLAFRHFQCQIPPATQGISIKGSPQFVSQVSNALQLLQDRAPQWWKYATRGLNTIKMVPEGSPSVVHPDSKTYDETLSEVLRKGTGEAGLVYVIFGIVHEACHVNDDHLHKDGLDEEKACTQASLDALQTIDPANDAGTIDWLKWIIANIHDPEVQWW